MRRVTSKSKRISSKAAARHLRHSHPIHQQDREAADRLRSTVIVEVPIPPRKEISFAADLAIQGIYENGKGRWVTEEFEQHIDKTSQARSWYRDGNGKKRSSKKPLLDTYVSVPPWWTKALTQQVEAGKLTTQQVRNLVASLASEAMRELEKRTGYEPHHLAIHPESENNLHFHLGLSTISKDNKLLGRSADGAVGKKGLRNAGDANGLCARMLPHFPKGIKKQWYDVLVQGFKKSHEKDKLATAPELGGIFNDDVALNAFVEKRLEERVPGLAPLAKRFALDHVRDWASKKEVAAQSNPEVMINQLDALRAENQQLKGQVIESLRSENEALKIGYNALKTENEQLKQELSGEVENSMVGTEDFLEGQSASKSHEMISSVQHEEENEMEM